MYKLTAEAKRKYLGSIMVDAAISIPIFIITLAMLLQIINLIAFEENEYYKAEIRIQTVSDFEGRLDLGQTVNDLENKIYIERVRKYPIVYKIKLPFSGIINAGYCIMDMPYKTCICESEDIYADEFVYIFPKNEGNEREAAKYHNKYCRTMKGACTKGLESERVTKDNAIARGYSLCKWCEQE